jgi:hypothetical protein
MIFRVCPTAPNRVSRTLLHLPAAPPRPPDHCPPCPWDSHDLQFRKAITERRKYVRPIYFPRSGFPLLSVRVNSLAIFNTKRQFGLSHRQLPRK